MKSLNNYINEKLVIGKGVKIKTFLDEIDKNVDKYLKSHFVKKHQVWASYYSFKIMNSAPPHTYFLMKKYHLDDDDFEQYKSQIQPMFNGTLYSWGYGLDGYSNDNFSTEFVKSIKTHLIEFNSIFENDDFYIKYLRTNNYRILIYGNKDTGRLMLSLIDG